VTGPHVEVYRWSALRAALELEQRGMKGRAGPLRPRLAAELGLKPRDSYDKFIESVSAKIAAVRVAADAQEGAA
jgi:hypothetical protein